MHTKWDTPLSALIKKWGRKAISACGLEPREIVELISRWSIRAALSQNGYRELVGKLREIVPDISNQESSEKETFNDYWELKRRALQAFQCTMMLRALERFPSGNLIVADIGDSAGTHMLYLKELAKDKFEIDTISVNLDPRAIEKIRARGLTAILSRAEDLDLGEKHIDLFTSFQMVEHLHNPANFFRRIAKRSACNRMVITLPYLKNSRVGLHHTRNKTNKPFFAEDEHIFELSPADWTLLLLHAGWRVAYSEIYYQYPRRLPVVSQILSWYWRTTDYEGFWGAILERDTTFSDLYQDWED